MTNTPTKLKTTIDEEYLEYLEYKPVFASFLRTRPTPCLHLDESDDIGAEDYIKARRNVLLCSPNSSTVIAGIYQEGKVTIKTFYRWLGMILSSDSDWHLMPWVTECVNGIQMNDILARDDERLIEPGKYNAVTPRGSDANLQPLNTVYMPRMYSSPSTPVTGSDYDFVYNVLKRDGGNCLISGAPYTYEFSGEDGTILDGLQDATWAHIFPVAYIEEWKASGLAAYMEGYLPCASSTKFLHSTQNGITLSRSHCRDFTSNEIAVDVDDGFRIVRFTKFSLDFPDSYLHFAKNEGEGHKLRPPNEMLRAHFQQVLYRYVLGGRDLQLADHERHHRLLLDEHVSLEEPCWKEGAGKAALEAYLARRLFVYLDQVSTEATMYPCKDGYYRAASMELQSLSEISWPLSFKTPEPDWPGWPKRSDMSPDEKSLISGWDDVHQQSDW